MALLRSIKNWFLPIGGNIQAGTEGKTKSNHNPNNTISLVQVERVRQDVFSWRLSLSEAERVWFPQRFKMQQMFADTVLNGHVQACILRRKSMVLQKDIEFIDEKTEKVNEEITKLFKNSWFYEIISSILDAQLYGYSLIAWDKFVGYELKDLRYIRRENISPDRKIVQPFVYSTNGKSWDDEDWANWMLYTKTINEFGKSECGYGLLYYVAYYEIFLRNNMGYNADFVEKFIMPYVVAKTSKTTEDERNELYSTVANMASSNAALIDPMDEIEFIESKNTGSAFNAFDNFETRAEKKISKVLLGHADAIDSTSGKLGSNEEVKEALAVTEQTQITFVENELKTNLLPKLKALGFIIPDGLICKFKNDRQEQESKKEEEAINQATVTIVKTLSDSGIEVDPIWITERTGIPVTKKAEPKSSDIMKQVNSLYGSI